MRSYKQGQILKTPRGRYVKLIAVSGTMYHVSRDALTPCEADGLTKVTSTLNIFGIQSFEAASTPQEVPAVEETKPVRVPTPAAAQATKTTKKRGNTRRN